jgi:hypothetical protein
MKYSVYTRFGFWHLTVYVDDERIRRTLKIAAKTKLPPEDVQSEAKRIMTEIVDARYGRSGPLLSRWHPPIFSK